MFCRAAIFVCLALTSFVANAAPEPVLEERQVNSVFNSLTSAAASAITGDGGSIISKITSAAGGVASDVTSIAEGVFETVTSAGGHAVTIVTSVGGPAITLAGDAGGVVTSFGGSLFTAATGAAGAVVTGTSNSAVGHSSFGITSSQLVGLATVVASALVGAIITF